MRKFSIFAAVAMTIAASLSTGHCFAQWPDTTRSGQDNHWIEVGVRAYNRPGNDLDIPLIVSGDTATSLFTADDASNGGSAPGLEIRYGFEGPQDRQLEFRSVIAEFQNTIDVDGPGLVSSIFGDEGSNGFNYVYDSRLLSFELNSYRTLAPGIRFSAGPRYISLTDTTNTQAQGTTPTGAPGVGPIIPLTVFSTREATNGLIGLQAGLDLQYQVSQQIYATGFIKTGGFYNPTEIDSSLQSFTDDGVLFDSIDDTTVSRSTGSFLAEVGGRLYVDLYENAVSAYVGYEATWIDGIALAPTVFLSGDTANVETSNTLFVQAVTFGLRLNF